MNVTANRCSPSPSMAGNSQALRFAKKKKLEKIEAIIKTLLFFQAVDGRTTNLISGGQNVTKRQKHP